MGVQLKAYDYGFCAGVIMASVLAFGCHRGEGGQNGAASMGKAQRKTSNAVGTSAIGTE